MKLYPYPEPRIRLKSQPDFSTEVVRWMGRNALRRLAYYAKCRATFPTVDALADWIVSVAPRYAGERFELGKFETMAEEAAVFALYSFDWEERIRREERGRNGGKKSRRGPSFTVDQLKDLEGLSIAQQAKALGCSTATIKRRRAELKAAEVASVEAELEELIPITDDVTNTIPETTADLPRSFQAILRSEPLHIEAERARQEAIDALGGADFLEGVVL